MTKQERFVLTGMLYKCGVPAKQISKVLNYFEENRRVYGTMIKQIISLKDHFSDMGYDEESLSMIMSDCRLYDHSIKKIVSIEGVLEQRGYTKDEIRMVEVCSSNIFGHDRDTLDKKLLYYNDIDVKNLIVRNSKNLIQGLKLSYARVGYLKDKSAFDNDTERMRMFWTQDRFRDFFGISNESLINRYPIKEEKYLVKKV